jgi:hypothetical protein
MKRIVSMAAVLFLSVAFFVKADSYTYTYVNEGITTNTSDAIPVSGWLDKIEISGSGSTRTSTVTIATYTGTTAVETFASSISNNTAKVIRPRVKGTDVYGTALTYAIINGGDATNVTQIVTVPYEKPMVGGNLKINIVNLSAGYNTNKVVIYYEPLKR